MVTSGVLNHANSVIFTKVEEGILFNHTNFHVIPEEPLTKDLGNERENDSVGISS